MYRNILVPLDGSELAECVFPHVEAIAAGFQAERVTLIRAIEPSELLSSPSVVGEFAKARKRAESEGEAAAKRYLQQLASRLTCDKAKLRTTVVVGKAAETIADYATNNGIDLIVLATHGRSGVSRWILGSTADRILRSACVPVLMVRAPGCIPGI
ncbi:MAG: UspA protein [Dehalococcoidia bacterium]|nr:UspA protein [Dehalococcoidia bacterium]